VAGATQEMVGNFRAIVGDNLFVMVPPPLYFGCEGCPVDPQRPNPFPDRGWHMNQVRPRLSGLSLACLQLC
jgi:hypothetical protein